MNVVKSLIALALLVFLSQGLQAGANDCIDTLMGNNPNDSSTFVLHSDDISRDFGRDYLAEAIFTVRVLLDREGCSRSDINFGKGPHGRSHSRCSKIIRNQEHTRVCYIESNLGYFFVTKDLLENINITYSRWD